MIGAWISMVHVSATSVFARVSKGFDTWPDGEADRMGTDHNLCKTLWMGRMDIHNQKISEVSLVVTHNHMNVDEHRGTLADPKQQTSRENMQRVEEGWTNSYNYNFNLINVVSHESLHLLLFRCPKLNCWSQDSNLRYGHSNRENHKKLRSNAKFLGTPISDKSNMIWGLMLGGK